MNSTDLVTMIGNLSRSLLQVQALLSGFAYIIGVCLIITALVKLKKVSGPSSGEGLFGPVTFFIGGAAFIFLPSMLTSLSTTAFGNSNILQYIQVNPFSIYNSMGIVIQTAGLIWFIRGSSLLVNSGEPGSQEGPKGFVFIIAGIFAMNFQATTGVVNYMVNHLISLSGLV